MTEKFNLTEKEKRIDIPERNISYNVFFKKDVAEFIRLIKEEIEKGVRRNKVLPLDWCFDRIDNLSGEAFSNHSPEEKCAICKLKILPTSIKHETHKGEFICNICYKNNYGEDEDTKNNPQQKSEVEK